MRRLGTLRPDQDWVNEGAALWYLIGYFGHEEIPDSFFETYTRPKLTRYELRKKGQEVREKIMLLKDDPNLANTR